MCGLSCATGTADAVDEINRGLTRASTDMTYETQTMENAYGVAGMVELHKGLSQPLETARPPDLPL